jgi:hypothetical protein
MEGPTADTCEKGGRVMKASLNSTLRDEVQQYLCCCEALLRAATGPRPFTIEEMALIQYLQDEVGKIPASVRM